MDGVLAGAQRGDEQTAKGLRQRDAQHDEEKVTTPHARSFVIPINWRTHSAKLVVCLE